MKLRSIIFGSAVAAAATASALTTTNTFARLPVTANYTNTIIALPFSGCGMAEGSIYVTNLVMTTNLENGDTLIYKDGNNWKAWEISGAPENPQWVGIATSTKAGGVDVTAPASQVALACGTACWLNRKTPTNTFYLYGQVNAAKTDVTVGGGSNGKVNYQIVGCPYEAGDFNVKTITTDVVEGDSVVLMANNPNGKVEFVYTNSAWKVWKKSGSNSASFPNPPSSITYDWVVPSDGEATVPAGCGFMYGRKSNLPLTITWGD